MISVQKSFKRDATCCEPGCETGWICRLNVCIHDTTGCQSGCPTDLTTGWTTGCISCIQTSNRLSKRLYTGCSILQPVGQPAASCKQTSNGLSNRIDNWLYRVNGGLGWCAAVTCGELLTCACVDNIVVIVLRSVDQKVHSSPLCRCLNEYVYIQVSH